MSSRGKDGSSLQAGMEIRFDARTAEDFAASLKLSSHSTTTYRKCLVYFFEYLSARGITRPESGDIEAYREELAALGKKAATVYIYLVAVRTFFRWAESEGLYRDISRGISIPQASHIPNRKTLTAAQLRKVMARIDRQSLQGLRDYAILALMLTGGLSAMEVSRAKAEDLCVSEKGCFLHVRDSDGQRQNEVKLPVRTVEALLKYLDARGPAKRDAPLFVSVSVRNREKNEHMTAGSVSRIVKGTFRRAGYEDANLTAQSLKVSAVKLAIQGGERLEDVQKFARHKQIHTTFLYGREVWK